MGVPICDKCIIKHVHKDIQIVATTMSKFAFFTPCTICDDHFEDKYNIPMLFESSLDIKDKIKALNDHLSGYEKKE